MDSERERTLWELNKRRYQEAQNRLDKDARHAFKDCRSVARLLFGAFSGGEIGHDTLRNAIDNLKALEEKNFGIKPALSIDDYLNRSEAYLSRIKKPESLSGLLGSRKVLVIDDEWQKVGWNLFFDSVFGKDKVLYAANPAEANTSVKDARGSVRIVFLDLNLPSDPSEGINLLQQVKTEYLDLPVVMFTKDETSRFVKKAIKEGAFDYFVKELDRDSDRDSFEYFQKFREISIDAMGQGRRAEVWNMIRNLEGKRPAKDISHYLRKAYYFLTTKEDSWSYRMLLSSSNITVYGEAILQCALALEWMVDQLFEQNRNSKVLKTLFTEKQLSDLTFSGKVKLLAPLKILTKDQLQICQDISQLRNQIVHPEKKGLKTGESAAVDALKRTVDCLDQILSASLI